MHRGRADDIDGRRWIAVCDGGLAIQEQNAPSLTLRWDQIELAETVDPTVPTRLTTLKYANPDGAPQALALGAFGGRRELIRSIRDRRPAPTPYLRRAVLATIVVVVVGLVGWLVAVARFMVRTEETLPADVGGFTVACKVPGTAYPSAAGYEGGAPHPTRFFLVFDSGDVSTDSGLPMDKLPRTWRWESVAEVQLVGCVEHFEEDDTIRLCPYGQGGLSISVPMHRTRLEINIYELRTHRRVDTITLFGADTECPESTYYVPGQDTNRVLSRVTSIQLTTALSRYID